MVLRQCSKIVIAIPSYWPVPRMAYIWDNILLQNNFCIAATYPQHTVFSRTKGTCLVSECALKMCGLSSRRHCDLGVRIFFNLDIRCALFAEKQGPIWTTTVYYTQRLQCPPRLMVLGLLTSLKYYNKIKNHLPLHPLDLLQMTLTWALEAQ